MTASLWASVAFCRAFDIVYVKLPITILPNSQTSGSSSLSPLKKNEKSKLTDHRKNLLFTYLWNPKVELIHRNSIFHEKKIAINYIGPTSFRASVVTKFRSHVTLEEMRISCIFWSCCRASFKKKNRKSQNPKVENENLSQVPTNEVQHIPNSNLDFGKNPQNNKNNSFEFYLLSG